MTTIEKHEQYRKVHFDNVVVDAHGDMYEINHRLNEGEEYPLAHSLLQRYREAGVDIITLAVGGDSHHHVNNMDVPLRGTIANIGRLYREVRATNGAASFVNSSRDIPDRPDGVFRYLLTLEGCKPLEGSVETLDAFHALGLRCIQLVWNYRNELGDGAMEQGTGGGLSRFGRDVLTYAQELGMVVDLAHATRETFWQALETARRPVIVSHANAHSVCPHPRNIEDEQIKALGEQGSFVGVQRSPGRVHPQNPTLQGFVDHIEYIASLIGTEHVGIGLDFNQNVGPQSHRDQRFGTHEVKEIRGFEELYNLIDVTRELLNRGFTESEVAGIMGGNFMRTVAREIGE